MFFLLLFSFCFFFFFSLLFSPSTSQGAETSANHQIRISLWNNVGIAIRRYSAMLIVDNPFIYLDMAERAFLWAYSCISYCAKPRELFVFDMAYLFCSIVFFPFFFPILTFVCLDVTNCLLSFFLFFSFFFSR